MISIALPIHNMEDAEYFLTRCLDSILDQSYPDFEVVITDNSPDNSLEKITKTYGMKINYSLNPRKGMAQNTNEAIKKCRGDLIKVLYMDDYLANKDSLVEIVSTFGKNNNYWWLVTGCTHDAGLVSKINPHYPSFHKNDEDNFIGSPSVLTFKRQCDILFDENMTWLLDLDFYKRMYRKYGDPILLHSLNVVIGIGDHQMTNIISKEDKLKEVNYLKQKHE